ncbi:PQQ-binding-like beta-propeller repeat protein [Streptomyces sp. BI20]|uniref:outer membrane protein assembly factor BamB family protein n=1 Tax=Streptomyces sp. BI20 TaxID=3403460 RepID=UPI003C762504
MSTPPPPQDPRDPRAGFGAPDPRSGQPTGPDRPAQPPTPPAQPPTDPSTMPFGKVTPGPAPTPPVVPPGAPVPPGPPAYGYPQQPPTTPEAAGYGFPPQPPTTPGFGAPTVPARPAASGGRTPKEKRDQLAIVTAAAVCCALIIGAGFWYSGNREDTGPVAAPQNSASPSADPKAPGGETGPAREQVPANTAAAMTFTLAQPELKWDYADTKGSWLTDTTFAKAAPDGIVGYDLDTGKEKWKVPLTGAVCGVSPHVTGDKAAVVFREAMPTEKKKVPSCNTVGVVDLAGGKLLWKAQLGPGELGGDEPLRLDGVTVSGETVAAAGLSGGGAWNLNDGKPRWAPKVDAENCADTGYAGGPALAVVRRCGEADPAYRVEVLDPVSGAPKSTYRLTPGLKDPVIVSTNPLVIAVNANKSAKNGSGVSDLFVVSETGALTSKISLTSGAYDPDCDTYAEDCRLMTVGNGKLYLPSVKHTVDGDAKKDTNELVSFDLATGKQTSDRVEAGAGLLLQPMRMDGPNVIAYKAPDYSQSGEIVSIDGKTMKVTTLLKLPTDLKSQLVSGRFDMDSDDIVYRNGRLAMSKQILSKPSSTSEPRPWGALFTAK